MLLLIFYFPFVLTKRSRFFFNFFLSQSVFLPDRGIAALFQEMLAVHFFLT